MKKKITDKGRNWYGNKISGKKLKFTIPVTLIYKTLEDVGYFFLSLSFEGSAAVSNDWLIWLSLQQDFGSIIQISNFFSFIFCQILSKNFQNYQIFFNISWQISKFFFILSLFFFILVLYFFSKIWEKKVYII